MGLQKMTDYISFFESGEDMTDEEYGLFMRTLHRFAFLDIEPDYSVLPPLVKSALRTAIASVRKYKKDVDNGSTGGRGHSKNPDKENTETGFSENINPPFIFSETKEKENENLKENGKEKEKQQEKQNISLSPSEPLYVYLPKDYAKQVFDVLKDNNLPCCLGNYISFMQSDFKFALETLHSKPELRGMHSDDVLGALKNYALVINNPNTWQGWKNKKSFDRFVSWERFKDFLPDRFCLDNFLDRSTPPPKQAQSKGVGLNRALEILEEVQNEKKRVHS